MRKIALLPIVVSRHRLNAETIAVSGAGTANFSTSCPLCNSCGDLQILQPKQKVVAKIYLMLLLLLMYNIRGIIKMVSGSWQKYLFRIIALLLTPLSTVRQLSKQAFYST